MSRNQISRPWRTTCRFNALNGRDSAEFLLRINGVDHKNIYPNTK
jgi:hypothetical protein